MRIGRSALAILFALAGIARAQGIEELSLAVASDDTARAQAALDAGAAVNADLGEGRTALITAVMLAKPRMVEFLLVHGADPNREAEDAAIGNALSACFFASSGMALIRRGDEDFLQDRRGKALESLKHLAARQPKLDILVSRGPTRMSPLMIAAEAGVPDVVKILLDAGASPNFLNGGKYGALDYAVDRAPLGAPVPEADRVETVRLLLAAGAQKNKKGADGLTPLDRARKAGSQWAVILLTP